jgi:hypothetical protein
MIASLVREMDAFYLKLEMDSVPQAAIIDHASLMVATVMIQMTQVMIRRMSA